jgi:hypothetical protein
MKSVTTSISIFLVVALIHISSVFANPVDPGYNDEKCLSKLTIIQKELADDQLYTRRWATAWGITWTVATVSQLAVVTGTRDDQTRKDLWVGSASAALGLIPTWFVPPAGTHATEHFGTSNSGCEAELSQSESVLAELSRTDESYSGPLAHISNVAVNLATSLILGLGFGHWGAAAISLGAGIPIGEVMILTYPKLGDQLHKVPQAAMIAAPAGPAIGLSFNF